MDFSLTKSPSSIGDIISSAIRVCRARVLFLVQILIGPSIFEIVGQLMMLSGGKLAASLDGKSFDWGDLHTVAIIGVLSAGGGLLCCIADLFLAIRQLAFVRWSLGIAKTYSGAYQSVTKRKWQVLAIASVSYASVFAWIVGWLVIASLSIIAFSTLPMFLQVTLGIFLTVCAIASLYLAVLALPMSMAVVACDELRIGETFNRSYALTFGNRKRSILFVSLLVAVYFILYFVLTSPLQGLYLFEYLRNALETGKADHDAPTPLYLETLNCMWYSVINMIVMPICQMSAGLYYRDMAMRNEGFDLLLEVNDHK